jgi:hypothetical protein
MAKSKEEPITKFEAVRRALKELGKDAKAQAIQAYASGKFGIQIELQQVYNAKSRLLSGKKWQAKKKQPAAKPSRAVTATSAASRNGYVAVEDVKALKELAARMGAERIQELLPVLG